MTAQRQLQAESTRFFDLSGDMLCTVGFDGTLHRVNGEWEKTLGWAPHELLGHSILEYMDPEDHEAATIATRAARLPSAPGAQLTTRCRAKNGSWHWIDWSMRTVDAEGRIYASGRDVTERRLAQRALARSEGRYRALVHGLPGTAVLVFDHDLSLQFAAGQALGASHQDPEELVGRHVSTMFSDADAVELTRACTAALTGRESSLDAVARADGHEVWVRTSPLRGEGGQIISAMLIAQDVHERVERERALKEAHERFRRAFENAPIGMSVTDLDGRYLEVNSALCAITGYTAPQLCARTFLDITHHEDVAAGIAASESMLEGSTWLFVTEKRYVRPDGDTVWVALTTTVVRDADGAPLHFLTQVQDVTERRRFESELRHLADDDPLTGLYNRRRFEQELERHVTDVARYAPRGALLVLDLDHFKYVNDALGHHAGDELILAVAAILRARLRDSDILARLGGDEFAVLLPTADDSEAEKVAVGGADRSRPGQGDDRGVRQRCPARE
ncbi:MAG: PAS domain S-box protein, partial [Solirubrobacteraceae bacterium]